MVNTAFIISIVVLALLGYLLGFARVLKFFTGGIFGIVISIVACAMLGGAIQSLPFVTNFITNTNNSAAEAWEFLKYLRPGYVVYYVILFIVVQLVRIIIIKVIKGFFGSENKLIKIINRSLGVVFMAGFSFALFLLFLAFIELIHETAFAVDFINKISGSFVYTLYENNPISFIL